VTIANLILDGGGAAQNGILFNTGGSLTIKNCVAQNFANFGIYLTPSGRTNFLITNVVATANATGITIETASTSASASVVLDHVVAANNGGGVLIALLAGGALSVTAVDSIAGNNTLDGFLVDSGTLRLAQSTAAQNGGYGVDCYGTCQSAGNNFIDGNTAGSVNGTLTNVGTK